MAVPHFLNVRTGLELMEPIWKGLFEVTVDFPAQLIRKYNLSASTNNDLQLVTENITSIEFGGVIQSLSVVDQRYKYSTRAFIGLPQKTHIEFKMNLQMNSNEKNAIIVYNLWRAWYNLHWNSQTGTAYAKRNTVGGITMTQHDKEGNTLRQIQFVNVQVKMFNGDFDSLNWANPSDIAKGSVDVVADFWYDLYVDHANG
jgi:hypothetical protein